MFILVAIWSAKSLQNPSYWSFPVRFSPFSGFLYIKYGSSRIAVTMYSFFISGLVRLRSGSDNCSAVTNPATSDHSPAYENSSHQKKMSNKKVPIYTYARNVTKCNDHMYFHQKKLRDDIKRLSFIYK